MAWKTLGIAAALACASAAGCSHDREARYVYRDGQYGVVGIPKNTASWRKHAERLMTQHFPEGYEIVREEEIDSGTRKSDLDAKRSTGIKPGAGMAHLLVGIGESSRSTEQRYQDELKLHESRIIYKKRTPNPEIGYAVVATLTPEMYADPNAKSRHDGDEKALVAGSKPKADPSVAKASADGP